MRWTPCNFLCYKTGKRLQGMGYLIVSQMMDISPSEGNRGFKCRDKTEVRSLCFSQSSLSSAFDLNSVILIDKRFGAGACVCPNS